MDSRNTHPALVVLLLPLAVETPPGFIRSLIESRLVAITLGLTALTAMVLWIAWQIRVVREHTELMRSETRDD